MDKIMINHHPHVSTLMLYAAGSLSERFSLVTAAHAEWCPQCRQQIREAEQLGGVMLDRVTPMAMSGSGFETCLSAAMNIEPESAPRPSTGPLTTEIPSVLATRLDRDLDVLPWKRLVQGIWHYALHTTDDDESGWIRLWRFEPTSRLPHHRHQNQEMSLVIQGGYRDQLGHFAVGDCADLDAGDAHSPQVDSDDDCIALIATNAPIKFEQWHHRIAAHWLGI